MKRALHWPAGLVSCAVIALATASGGEPVLRAQSTPPFNGFYQLVARHSGKCLEVNGALTGDAAEAIQWDCHAGESQQWSFELLPDGYYRLTARHSGKALDVAGASLTDAARVIQLTPTGAESQQWRVADRSEGATTSSSRATAARGSTSPGCHRRTAGPSFNGRCTRARTSSGCSDR